MIWRVVECSIYFGRCNFCERWQRTVSVCTGVFCMKSNHFVSIRIKIVMLTMCSILICTAILGGAGIYACQSVTTRDADKIMNLTADDEATILAGQFKLMADSVDVMASDAVRELSDYSLLKDNLYVRSYLYNLDSVFYESAAKDDRILAYYYHLNPDYAASDAGFVFRRSQKTGSFQSQLVPDLKKYLSTDPEVSWYFTAHYAQRGIFTNPHYDDYHECEVISYLFPVYFEKHEIGVIGLDLDFSSIAESLDAVSPYDDSFAFLVDQSDKIVYSKDDSHIGINLFDVNQDLGREVRASAGVGRLIRYETEDRTVWFSSWRRLENGMRIVVTAPYESVYRYRNQLISLLVYGVILILFVSFLVTTFIANHIVHPIQKLTNGARAIADGNLQVVLKPDTNDEIRVLTESIDIMEKKLNEHIEKVRELAYRDPLTGVRSKTAYKDEVAKLQKVMEDRVFDFAIVVCDLNHLKLVNDNFGHETGDEYIINSCYMLCQTFKRSPVYRIGGDEFVVILTKHDFEEREELCQKLFEHMQESCLRYKDPESRISIAYGVAEYFAHAEKPLTDYQELFRIGDERMYEKKKEMGGGRR